MRMVLCALVARSQSLCAALGHAQIVDLDGRPVAKYRDTTGRCSRCGYIGVVDEFTGRLFWGS